MNYEIELLYNNLFQTINKSGVSVGAAYFVVKDLLRDLETTYKQVAEKERAEWVEGRNRAPMQSEDSVVPTQEEIDDYAKLAEVSDDVLSMSHEERKKLMEEAAKLGMMQNSISVAPKEEDN